LEPDRRENYLYLTPERSYALMGSNRQKRFFSELIESDINVKASLTYRYAAGLVPTPPRLPSVTTGA